MVLLGVATASGQLTAALVPGLLVLALSFHVYAYVLNDVVDLPVDRTDPRRAKSPLVTGAVTTRTAKLVAFGQIPVVVVIVLAMGGGGPGLVTVGVLLAAITIYDVWGKRCPVPPLTDLVQGVAWAALGWLGAILVGGPTGWTVTLALYFIAFIMLANGVHGSIRDLANDRRRGARTTATWFGAEIRPSGSVEVTGAYLLYALCLQAGTVSLVFVPTKLGWEQTGWPRLAAMFGAGVASTVLLVVAARASDRHRQLVVGTWHLILVLASVFVMVAHGLPVWAMAGAVICYVLPFAAYRWLFRPKPPPGTHWTVESTSTR